MMVMFRTALATFFAVGMSFTFISCHTGDDLLEDVLAAVQNKDINGVRKHLTGNALEQIKTIKDLEPWSQVLNRARRYGFSVDTIYRNTADALIVSAYAVFDVSDNETVLGLFELSCDSLIGFGSDHAMPSDCKISNFEKPKVTDAIFEAGQVLIYAYACGYLYYQERLFEVLKENLSVNPRDPVGTGGPRPRDEILARVIEEYGSAHCRNTFQRLKRR